MALNKRLPQVRLQPTQGRPLTREDVDRLTEPRLKGVTNIIKIRESHHYVARLVAAGFSDLQVAERTGYSGNRIAQLRAAPAFIELVSSYRKQVTENVLEEIDEYHRLLTGNMLAAERHIADTIAEADEQGELIPISTALKVARDAADRLNYGKKNTNINVNVDFASQLEAAIRRSGKTLEAIPASTREPGVMGEVGTSRHPHASPSTLDLVPSGGQGSQTTGEGATPPSTLPPPSNSFRRI